MVYAGLKHTNKALYYVYTPPSSLKSPKLKVHSRSESKSVEDISVIFPEDF